MGLTNRFELKRWARTTASAALGAGLMGLLATAAVEADPPDCPIAITACGCVISQTGTYTAANDLSASQTSEPNCIEIAAAHSILNLKGVKVLGNNAGIGILIDRKATSVIVEGGDEADGSPQAVVSQWNIGIEDDADGAIIEAFNAIGGLALLPSGHTPGNVTGGVLLKAVENSIIGDFVSSYNGKFGVKLVKSSMVHIANATTQKNGDVGIRLDASNSNRIGPATTAGNANLGTWLLTSSHNLIHDLPGATGNGNTGILIGCGLKTKNCPGNERSDRNRVINSGAPGNAKAGIVIRKHSESNLVTVNHNDGNGGKQMDMVDENNKCDSNVWYNNTGQGNQACIQ